MIKSKMRKNMMKRHRLKILLLLAAVSAIYAGVSISQETEKGKAYEPAGKFVPTEKLSADDTVAFPVDI